METEKMPDLGAGQKLFCIEAHLFGYRQGRGLLYSRCDNVFRPE